MKIEFDIDWIGYFSFYTDNTHIRVSGAKALFCKLANEYLKKIGIDEGRVEVRWHSSDDRKGILELIVLLEIDIHRNPCGETELLAIFDSIGMNEEDSYEYYMSILGSSSFKDAAQSAKSKIEKFKKEEAESKDSLSHHRRLEECERLAAAALERVTNVQMRVNYLMENKDEN